MEEIKIKDGFIAIAIILLSILDGFFTLYIIGAGGTEINPVMLSLLDINNYAFVNGKLALISLSTLVIFKHRKVKLFGIIETHRFLHLTFLIFCVLICYELYGVYLINEVS